MLSTSGSNWGGNVAYRAARVAQPATLVELVALCTSGTQLSVVASRHSFSGIGDGETLVDLSLLSAAPVVDADAKTVLVTPTTTYAELALALDATGHALHNLASLPHISVGGAVATATHGSGSNLANLATAVVGVELVTADGSVRTFEPGTDGFAAVVVGLGSLGVVTGLTLAIEPSYDVEQRVFDGLDWNTLTNSFDELLGASTSVSVFTRWGDQVGEVWSKQRVDQVAGAALASFGLDAATGHRHPIPGVDGKGCTQQMGQPGRWWERLTHFRSDEVPSTGAEIQSEVFVDRADSAAAIAALRKIGPQLDHTLLVGEIRTIASDDLAMSPHNARTSTGLHFTWRLDSPGAQRCVDLVAAALEPFAPRPHLGKMLPTGWHAAGVMPGHAGFITLKNQLDPAGTFTTPWFERHIA